MNGDASALARARRAHRHQPIAQHRDATPEDDGTGIRRQHKGPDRARSRRSRCRRAARSRDGVAGVGRVEDVADRQLARALPPPRDGAAARERLDAAVLAAACTVARSGRSTRWPTSPAVPDAPAHSSPSTTMPAATPVPKLRYARASVRPRSAAAPRAAALTSFSTAHGEPELGLDRGGEVELLDAEVHGMQHARGARFDASRDADAHRGERRDGQARARRRAPRPRRPRCGRRHPVPIPSRGAPAPGRCPPRRSPTASVFVPPTSKPTLMAALPTGGGCSLRRHQPLTAPADIPATRWRWMMRKKTTTGSANSTEAAICPP